MALFHSNCPAQTAINTVSTATSVVVSGGTLSQLLSSSLNAVNGILTGTSYTVKYNNTGNVNIIDFALAGKTYVRFSNFDTIFLRRVANAWETTGGNKQHVFFQGPATLDNITKIIPFPVAYPASTTYNFMQRVMKQGYINRGSDNLFNNDSTSDLTYNNIERVDFVFKVGFKTTDVNKSGFLIAERGGNDAFKIFAITAVDANGNPTAFGPVLNVPATAYGAAVWTGPTFVMRKDASDNNLRPFSQVASQSVKSVFIKLGDLGVAAGQRIYGYSMAASDVTATTSAQLLAYTNNTYFPRTSTTTSGGMDVAAAPGIFQTDLVLAGKYLVLTVHEKNNSQVLEWTDKDYEKTKEYHIEKSIDKENYNDLGVMLPNEQPNYTMTDDQFTGNSYYRVKVLQKNGSFFYSSIIFAKSSMGSGTVNLYPNPVRDQLTVSYDPSMHVVQIEMVTLNGTVIGQWRVNENNKILQVDMSAMPKGNYILRLVDVNNQQKTIPLVKI